MKRSENLASSSPGAPPGVATAWRSSTLAWYHESLDLASRRSWSQRNVDAEVPCHDGKWTNNVVEGVRGSHPQLRIPPPIGCTAVEVSFNNPPANRNCQSCRFMLC
jgi:hypothetical protein